MYISRSVNFSLFLQRKCINSCHVSATRWLHIQCDGMKNDDEAERAASYGYHCLLCRPLTGVDGPCKFVYVALNISNIGKQIP